MKVRLLLDTHVLLWAAAEPKRLPLHHRDPFDRILVAQAIHEPARLLTVDGVLGKTRREGPWGGFG